MNYSTKTRTQWESWASNDHFNTLGYERDTVPLECFSSFDQDGWMYGKDSALCRFELEYEECKLGCGRDLVPIKCFTSLAPRDRNVWAYSANECRQDTETSGYDDNDDSFDDSGSDDGVVGDDDTLSSADCSDDASLEDGVIGVGTAFVFTIDVCLDDADSEDAALNSEDLSMDDSLSEYDSFSDGDAVDVHGGNVFVFTIDVSLNDAASECAVLGDASTLSTCYSSKESFSDQDAGASKVFCFTMPMDDSLF